MKKIANLIAASLAIMILTFVGCSGTDFSIAPVSGKITNNGEPVPNLRVVFTPMPNEANTDPGPWSTAVTDAQGMYQLKTRYKKNGAAVGKHTVSFEFEDPEDMEGLQDDLDAAMGEEGSKEEVAAVKKRIADFRARQASRPRVTEDMTMYCEITKGGTEEANFDLAEVK